MTAITTRKDVRRQENNVGHLKLANNTTIPEGALVGINSSGLAVNAVASTGARVAGVATKTASNQNGKSDDHVEFDTYGVIDVVASFSAAQSDVGAYVKVVDNQTVAKLVVSGETPDAAELNCGRIVEVLSSSRVRIALKTV